MSYYDDYRRNYVNEAILKERAYTAEQRQKDADEAAKQGNYDKAGPLWSQARRMREGKKPYGDFE